MLERLFLRFVESFSWTSTVRKKHTYHLICTAFKRYAFKNIYHATYLYGKILSEMILLPNDSFTVHCELMLLHGGDEEEEMELQRKTVQLKYRCIFISTLLTPNIPKTYSQGTKLSIFKQLCLHKSNFKQKIIYRTSPRTYES